MLMWIKWHWLVVRCIPSGGRLWTWAVKRIDADHATEIPK